MYFFQVQSFVQGMTNCVKFTILYKDYLVMKKIGNWPITEADTDFSKLQKMSTKNLRVSERFQEVLR